MSEVKSKTLAQAASDMDIGSVGKEAKPSDNKGYKPIAVFYAHVKAYSGPGNTTALVIGPEGHYGLLGRTNLVNAGLFAPEQLKLSSPKAIGEALHVPIFYGAAACRKALSDFKVPESDIPSSRVLWDVKEKASNKKAAGEYSRKLNL